MLDPKQQVVGYRLGWQSAVANGGREDADNVPSLLALVAERAAEFAPSLFFFDLSPADLSSQALQNLAPESTVLVLRLDDLLTGDPLASLTSLRERGFGLGLRDGSLAFLKTHERLAAQFNYLLLACDHPELAELCNFARHRQPPFTVVADGIPDWPAFDLCAGLGAHCVFENLCLAPRLMAAAVKLGPQAQQILQLMQMVQADADIRHVEKVLESDLTLSYKLLRYINSAGFGLRVEIESPRHAVSMLGYAPMFRWLSLLLARTNSTGFSPALMQAAMVRGRFAELLGQGFLSLREAEDLFVVGMFSFLDRLMGIPVQQVLSQLTLSETVKQALLSRDGIYGPVLALAEASERENGGSADLAAALNMTAQQANQAHLSALAWAQSIKL